MSGPLFGDPVDPNPEVTLAAPDYSAWYPAAPTAAPVGYPNYSQPPVNPSAAGYPPYPPYPGYPGYPPFPGYPGEPAYSSYPVYPGYPTYAGYPPPGVRRPGEVTAASVLSLISAAIVLITGFIIIFAVSMLDSPDSGVETLDDAHLFVVAGLIDIVTAALLIVGALLLLGRARSGRPVLAIGIALCVGQALIWLIGNQRNGGGNIAGWLLIYGGPVITAAVLISTNRVRTWLAGAPPA